MMSEELRTAARDGDLSTIKEQVEAGADIHALDDRALR